jgi:hypothetical protein
LYDKEREVEEIRRENGVLVSERNNLDEQFSHVLRKMKRLEKENNEMRTSYPLLSFSFFVYTLFPLYISYLQRFLLLE